MGPSPRGPRLLCRLPALLLPTLVLILLVLAVLAVPAEGKPIAMASPDQVKDTERSRPQLWSGPSGTRTSRRSQKVTLDTLLPYRHATATRPGLTKVSMSVTGLRKYEADTSVALPTLPQV